MERRRPEAVRLRWYLDAIKQARETTDAEWVENWIKTDQMWLSRETWIKILESWALAEATLLMDEYKEAA